MQLDLKISVDDELAKILTDLTVVLGKLVTQDTNQENTAMADLSQLKTEVASLGSVTEAVSRVIDFLVERLQQSGNSQAEIDALVTEIQGSKQELVDTIASLPHPDNTLPDSGQ